MLSLTLLSTILMSSALPSSVLSYPCFHQVMCTYIHWYNMGIAPILLLFVFQYYLSINQLTVIDVNKSSREARSRISALKIMMVQSSEYFLFHMNYILLLFNLKYRCWKLHKITWLSWWRRTKTLIMVIHLFYIRSNIL